MKFISTRKGFAATSAESVFQGLASDGGLYVPALRGCEKVDLSSLSTLRDCEEAVLGVLFDDLPAEVRTEAVNRLLSRFPAENPIPLVSADGFEVLELFHGKTGAFKDVALSMLPVFMKHAAGGKRVLILTATSGDTGSAAMQGFAGVEGTEVLVFFPNTGTSKVQRLQMTTPADANVHAVAIKGNFDDAQAAVKRIFADKAINDEAAAHGVTLSSANSINTGRLIPQIAYYLLAAVRIGREFDVVVPSGNFGNILAAYYAKALGAPIRKFVCASNVNDVLARFVKTGVYDPGEKFTITNSPSMDIRKSSNVERLLWILNDGDGEEVSRLMDDLATMGRYELNDKAKKRLFADFDGGVATPEETEAEMRRMKSSCGYVLDPHTAVATAVARKLSLPSACPCVIAATATPYKFPETCARAFGEDVLTAPPSAFAALETLPVVQNKVVDLGGIDQAVKDLF